MIIWWRAEDSGQWSQKRRGWFLKECGCFVSRSDNERCIAHNRGLKEKETKDCGNRGSIYNISLRSGGGEGEKGRENLQGRGGLIRGVQPLLALLLRT